MYRIRFFMRTLCWGGILLMTSIAPAFAKTNLMLITIDTLRGDRLGCYGYAEARTPELDRLAGEGVLFENAFSTVPLTLPAHTSILTGTYPLYHGVRDNSGYRLAESHVTLAETLRESGYRTGAFVGAFVLDSKFGLDQGFDTYFDNFDLTESETISPGYIQRTGDEVVSESLKWLDSSDQRPFFAWVHLYDPHDPYTPPEPFAGRHPGQPYDGEIEFTDHNVGILLDWLRSKQLYDETLIVVVGDHGESLGEHGEEKHGLFIYRSTLHVPLIIRFPGGSNGGERLADYVSLVDLFPTVAQALELPRNQVPTVQGIGLLSTILRKRSPQRSGIYAESYYAYREFGWSPLRSFIGDHLKYIAAPEEELYQLDDDPNERVNIAKEKKALTGQLKQQLAQFEARYSGSQSDASAVDLDSESLEKLRSLGYVALSGGSTRLPEQIDGLADPKRKIELYNRLMELFALSLAGRHRETLSGYREVLEQDPGMVIVRYKLGQALFHLEDYTGALEQFTKVTSLKGDESLATFDLAQTYLRLGRPDDAILGFERTLQLDPQHYRAKVNLGVLYKNRGDMKAAIAQLEGAVELAPTSIFALSNLGVSYSIIDDHQSAVRMLTRAYELAPTNAMVCANLGVAYRRMGEEPRALEFLRKAHKLDPRIPSP